MNNKSKMNFLVKTVFSFLLLSGLTMECPSIALAAQDPVTKSPITHEKMCLMKRVGAPVPSPDGKWVVFSVTEPAYDEKDQVIDLWIASADSKAKPRRLT